MNRSNRVAETKALISFGVTASLFLHVQKTAFCMTGLLLFPSNSNIRKTATTILDRDLFST